MPSDTGQIQITKTGVSGIPVFNISRYAAKALSLSRPVRLHIRAVPGLSEKELYDELLRRFSRKETTPYEALIGLLPDSFADSLLRFLHIAPDRLITDVKRVTDTVYKALLDTVLNVSGNGDMSEAQVTSGGVSVSEVDPLTMESRLVKGLYLAGELLDIDGKCGGYSLYFAWASGYIAGSSV